MKKPFFFPERIFGVDFSGAKGAGNAIWISECEIQTEQLFVKRCYPGRDLPESGVERDRCLAALRTFIRQSASSLWGLDFPFSLPQSMMGDAGWTAWLAEFPQLHPNADAFRDACRAFATGQEMKRRADVVSRVPFSPYNLRIYRQTYYGLVDLLSPLINNGQALALPFQQAQNGVPWLLEACPASYLKRVGKYLPYKGKSTEHRHQRSVILRFLQENGLQLAVPDLQDVLINDAGGDALDSLLAAAIIFRLRSLKPPFIEEFDLRYQQEGFVYH